MIFAWMKMLDATSAVRPSEYATAENARGVPETIRNLHNKLLQGTILTPEQVKRYVGQAARTGEGWRKTLQSQMKHYTDIARRRNLEPENIVVDYFGTIPEENFSQEQPGNVMSSQGDASKLDPFRAGPGPRNRLPGGGPPQGR
jgi:hypothetical protein